MTDQTGTGTAGEDGGARIVREWCFDMEKAPKDRWIIVYAPGGPFNLSDIVCLCKFDNWAGFCVDETRDAQAWMDLPQAPEGIL